MRVSAGMAVLLLSAATAAVPGCSREGTPPMPGGATVVHPAPPPMILPSLRPARLPDPEEGVALAIVFDTSGSMGEPVADGKGGTEVKRLVALRALGAVVDRIDAWRSAAPPDAPRRVDAALVVFNEQRGSTVLPMAPLDVAAFRAWIEGHRVSSGPTPLGDSLRNAAEAVIPSALVHKHVIVVTDGENSTPPAPGPMLRAVRETAAAWKTAVRAHFVAFDVDAKVFDAVKAEGATVVSASDARMLEERLRTIVENEILLESDAPAAGAPGGR